MKQANKRIHIVGGYIAGAAAIAIPLTYFMTMKYSRIHIDSGYYLSNALRISEGYTPYSEIHIMSTPLAYYLLLIPGWILDGQHDYAGFIGTIFAFSVATAIILYLTLRSSGIDQTLSLVVSLLYLLAAYRLDGLFIVLEPYVMFFACVAILAESRWPNSSLGTATIGISAFLGFMVKQYGLAILGGFCLFYISVIIISLRDKKKSEARRYFFKTAMITGSFCFCLFLFFLAAARSGVSWKDITTAWLGGGYGFRSVADMLGHIAEFYLKEFWLFAAFGIVCRKHLDWKGLVGNRMIWLLLCITVTFSLSMYFKTYRHYLIFILPTSLLFFAICGSHINGKKYKSYYQIIFLLVLFVGVARTAKHCIKRVGVEDRVAQMEYAKEIGDQIPTKTKVFNCADPTLNYLCGFFPPSFENAGYVFLDNFSEAELKGIAAEAECAITSDAYLRSHFGDRVDIPALLRSAGFHQTAELTGSISLWRRSATK